MIREDFLNSLIGLCQNITAIKKTEAGMGNNNKFNNEVKKIMHILKTHVPKLATLLTEAVILIIDDVEMMTDIINEAKNLNKEIKNYIQINKPLNIFTLIHKYPLEFIEAMATYYLKQQGSGIKLDNLEQIDNLKNDINVKYKFNEKISQVVKKTI